jgi:nuclear pore complex protein Nup107
LSVESLSLSRTQALCGYPFDFTQPGTEDQDEIQVTQAARNATPGRASLKLSEIPSANQHTHWVMTLRQLSSVYYELQQIVRLIALFREWRGEEENLIQ